ncbi:hypothetical protein [Micromonospora echinofusca]|uniref:SIS domain-containing protein n=1 Tax=Micromonospora echinofusca TaxID=47858 RepID=A0ABS3VVR5_MICEH|nr:hypothetical protein [Micromonospora echinofusca]MBO4208641.1 hypothetical protein [Micromonospora echinofusca]
MGHGLALPLVEFMRAKLTLAGLHVDPITQTGHGRAERLAALRPDDTLMVFAFSEDYMRMSTQLQLVAERGTTILLLTDEDTLLHNHLPHHVIAIPRDRARHGVIVSMTALCYAIRYDLLQHRADASRAMRQRIDELHAAGEHA